jgi:hypothetical protein
MIERALSEDEVQGLISERNPQRKPECEACMFVFSPRSCFDSTKQGGTGEGVWLPFSGWEGS